MILSPVSARESARSVAAVKRKPAISVTLTVGNSFFAPPTQSTAAQSANIIGNNFDFSMIYPVFWSYFASFSIPSASSIARSPRVEGLPPWVPIGLTSMTLGCAAGKLL